MEYKMDATLLELIERMEVKVNIMEEENRQKAFKALQVERMQGAWPKLKQMVRLSYWQTLHPE